MRMEKRKGFDTRRRGNRKTEKPAIHDTVDIQRDERRTPTQLRRRAAILPAMASGLDGQEVPSRHKPPM